MTTSRPSGAITTSPTRSWRGLPKLLGLDPGLGTTGWGVIQADGNRLSHIANGQLKTERIRAFAGAARGSGSAARSTARRARARRRRGRGGVRQQEPAVDAEARPGARRDPDVRRAGRNCRRRICAAPRQEGRGRHTAEPKRRRCTRWFRDFFRVRKSPARTPRTRWQSRSPTPIIWRAPAASLKPKRT